MIAVDKKTLSELCEKHRIHKLCIFGSAVRDDFNDDSDVDLLIDWEPGYSPGWDILDVENDFAAFFGRDVDLVNRKYIKETIRDRVLREAKVQYERP